MNRDGTGLTLLAGIMQGYQCDLRIMSSIDLHLSHGINPRDMPSTHLHRANRSLSRSSKPIHLDKRNKLNNII